MDIPVLPACNRNCQRLLSNERVESFTNPADLHEKFSVHKLASCDKRCFLKKKKILTGSLFWILKCCCIFWSICTASGHSEATAVSSGVANGSLHLQQQGHRSHPHLQHLIATPVPCLGLCWYGFVCRNTVTWIRSQYSQYSIFSVESVSQSGSSRCLTNSMSVQVVEESYGAVFLSF